MLKIRPSDVRRVYFATKLFPRLKSIVKLDKSKLKSLDFFDGETFAGGRSVNKDLLKYFGFIANSSVGFIQLPGFRRSLKKLVALVEHELELAGCQEVLIPALVPQRLWHRSERLKRQPNALDSVFKFDDPNGHPLLIGPTFEESITHFIANIDGSIGESELPIRLYQSSPKYRFEPVPKFGLIRSNEFFMNDLYTFDATLEKATETYNVITGVYQRIFEKLGLNCVRTLSDPGSIGGKYSHEFQLPVSSGEDVIMQCSNCQMFHNRELLKRKDGTEISTCPSCNSYSKFKAVKSLELGHTFLLSDVYSKPLRALYSSVNEGPKTMEMGCYGIGLTRTLGAGIDLLSIIPKGDANESLEMRWPRGVEPFKLGIVPPANRSKQFHAGSTDFIQRILDNLLRQNSDIDVLVEDRGKESLVMRMMLLKSLGLPYIIVVGQRFLLDKPEVELLKLGHDRKKYEQLWLTEEQLYDFFEKNMHPTDAL